MEPMYLQVLQKETGRQIKKLLVENGYTVKDVQNAMGFENPQAVYKWISGRSLPSLDNFVILSRLLHTSIEDINDRLRSVRQTEALKEAAKDTNLALHEIFKYLMQNYVKFDWNDRMLVPHQRYVDNIKLLDRADRELTEANRAGVISALEAVDYNYYASYFSRNWGVITLKLTR